MNRQEAVTMAKALSEFQEEIYEITKERNQVIRTTYVVYVNTTTTNIDAIEEGIRDLDVKKQKLEMLKESILNN